VTDRLFIGIGVSKAHRKKPLPGVWKGIHDLAKWAQPEYQVVVVTDENGVVDIERLRLELMPNLRTGLDRIIVYFCGHGYGVDPDQYWLLSGSQANPSNRISRDAFRDQLSRFGPRQIAIFSDACRVRTKLTKAAHWVIDEVPEGEAEDPRIDGFYSTQDLNPAFAVESEDKCIFTWLVHRALTLQDGSALDASYFNPPLPTAKVVTSQSLARFLLNKVPDEASKIGVWQKPQVDPGFWRPGDEYVMVGFPSSGIPPRDVLNTRNLDAKESWAKSSGISPSYREYAKLNTPSVQALRERTKSEWNSEAREAERVHFGLPWEYRDADPFYLKNLYANATLIGSRHGRIGPIYPALHPELRLPPRFEVYCTHLSMDDLLPTIDFLEKDQGPLRPQKFDLGFLKTSNTATFILRAKDSFAPVTMFRNLWCFALLDSEGVQSTVWGSTREPRSKYPPNIRNADLSEDAIKVLRDISSAGVTRALTNGALSSDDSFLVAMLARYNKHIDPSLGIVAAYLYDSIGDVDNIRRMCWYYNDMKQDIPFDIAMLAKVNWSFAEGAFKVSVPATRAVRPRVELPDHVTRGTEEFTAKVAGATPLVGSGWLRMKGTGQRQLDALVELSSELSDSPVATIKGVEAGYRLIEIFESMTSRPRPLDPPRLMEA